ncbi:MAG: hypothetical protein WBD20_04535 [Pirellulaceae bacterium]
MNELNASWGENEVDWGLTRNKNSGWLGGRAVYCLLCDAGELDVFIRVAGLDSLADVRKRAVVCETTNGNHYPSLSREDMLACQMAIPEQYRRKDRIEYLQKRDVDE